MSSDLSTLSIDSDFKQKIREKVLGSLLEFIPAEKFDAMIAEEIKMFFETPQMLTVKPTQVAISNPQYNPKQGYGYHNEPTIKLDCLAFGSHMTPFRQLVWTVIHEYLRPKLEAEFRAIDSETARQMDEQFTNIVAPKVKEVNAQLFQSLSHSMSLSMLNSVVRTANSCAVQTMRQAFANAGMDTSLVPDLVFSHVDHDHPVK